MVDIPDNFDRQTELYSAISIWKGAALSDKPFNEMELNGEFTVFTEISGFLDLKPNESLALKGS